MAQETLLELKNFSSFDLVPINLKIRQNETVSISGESGTGKSLLLRAIADLIPHKGDVFLEGNTANDYPPNEWRKQVAYLAAESQWWFDTIGEHFQLPLSMQTQKYLEEIGFDINVLDWEVMRCSTGERQRLAIIRMLANLPKVLLLDEPTANLDTDNSMLVESIIKHYQNETSCSIILVSHNAEQKKRIAQRQYQIQGKDVVEVEV